MCISNLMVITHSENSHFSTENSNHKETLGLYNYTRDQLITISDKLKDSKYCIPPFTTINKIRDLGLNKHKVRKHNNRYLLKPKKVNTKNLIQINPTEKSNSNNIRIATINVRSVKNKQQQIVETTELENIDFIRLTEPWLKNTDEDKACINTSDLNNNNLRIDTVSRIIRQGGGIALLHRKEYNTTRLETNLQLDTIEHRVWSMTIRNKKLTLAGIYHPPIGSSNGNMYTKFLKEVSKLIQLVMTNYTNVVLLGDFNIHTQDTESPDSITYNDMMEALGLQQHIDIPTHKFGNTLDLIHTESLDRVRVIHFFIGNFISNHRVVGIELEIRKQLEKYQSTKHRNYKDFNLNNFSQVFNNSKILDQSSLEDALQALNEEMENPR